MPDNRYTAEQLAQLSGATLRTVRYYVQEGLIDRPEARGPGAHFTDRHLRQLKRCQLLQDWGFDLETIRDKASSFQGILDGFAGDTGGLDRTMLRAVLQAMTGDESQLTRQHAAAVRAVTEHYRKKGLVKPEPRSERKSSTERIPMADGIDLVVDKSVYGMPSPKELVDIALLIRKTFDAVKKLSKDEDDDD
jgi:DNA-binding transcriptional MerR regulator